MQANQIYVHAGDMVGVHTGSNDNDRVWLTYETTDQTQSEGVTSDDLHYVETLQQRDVFDNETGWSKDYVIYTRTNNKKCVSLRVYYDCGKPMVISF